MNNLLNEVYNFLIDIGCSIATPLDIELSQAGYAMSEDKLSIVYAVVPHTSKIHLYYIESNRYVIGDILTDDFIDQPEIKSLCEAPLDDILAYFNKLLYRPTLRDQLANHRIVPTKFHLFGIEPLDDKLMGIYMGSLTLVVGKSNTGKTYYCLKFMESFIRQGLNVDFINLEMPENAMLDQFKRFDMNIPTNNISGLFNSRGAKLTEVLSHIRSRAANGVQVFIVDWLDRMIDKDLNPAMRPIAQANIADALSALSYELNVAIILTNQVNKSTNVATGVIDWYNNIAGSSQVYNVCDTFIGLFDRTALKPQARDDPKLKYVIELHVDKARKYGQQKGVAIVKSVNNTIRYLDFNEQYAYDEHFNKKSMVSSRKSKLDEGAEERFKELEQKNNQWAKKLDSVYTGEKENTPF